MPVQVPPRRVPSAAPDKKRIPKKRLVDRRALIALVVILKMYICVLFVPLAGTKLQRSKVHVLNVWWAEKHQRKKPRLRVLYVIMVNVSLFFFNFCQKDTIREKDVKY